MRKIMLNTVLLLSFISSAFADESLVSIKSDFTVKESADRFEKILKQKGFTVFSRIDHSKNASNANLSLEPVEVVIFGNPKIGTLLMQCSKTVAIDLPQKMLFWVDENNQNWLTYNNPKYLKERHNIEGCDQVITKISGALDKLSKEAANK